MKSATKVLKPDRFQPSHWVGLVYLRLSRRIGTLFCFLAIAQLLGTVPIDAAQAPAGSPAPTQTPGNPSPASAPTSRDQPKVKSSDDNPPNGKASRDQSTNFWGAPFKPHQHNVFAISIAALLILNLVWCFRLQMKKVSTETEELEPPKRTPRENRTPTSHLPSNSHLQADISRINKEIARIKEDNVRVLAKLNSLEQKGSLLSVPAPVTESVSLGLPKTPVVEVPTPEPPPPLITSERNWIGLAFTWFCRTDEGEPSIETFCNILRKKLPDALAATVIRPSDSNFDYFVEKNVSGSEYWRITVGQANYLLPCYLLREQEFRILGSLFDFEGTINSGTIEGCVPTLLAMDNHQQVLKEKGQLTSTPQSNEILTSCWRNFLDYNIGKIEIPPPDSPSQPVSANII